MFTYIWNAFWNRFTVFHQVELRSKAFFKRFFHSFTKSLNFAKCLRWLHLISWKKGDQPLWKTGSLSSQSSGKSHWPQEELSYTKDGGHSHLVVLQFWVGWLLVFCEMYYDWVTFIAGPLAMQLCPKGAAAQETREFTQLWHFGKRQNDENDVTTPLLHTLMQSPLLLHLQVGYKHCFF